MNLYKIFIRQPQSLYSAYILQANFVIAFKIKPVEQPEEENRKKQSFSHLKWPAIILAILIFLLILSLDYCSRQGEI